MAADLGLNLTDLERIFAAELLRLGPSMEEAARMARNLANAFHAQFKGKRITIHLSRKHYRVLSPDDRKRIFLDWYVGGSAEHEICSQNEICRRTLERIKAQGRKENWAGRRA